MVHVAKEKWWKDICKIGMLDRNVEEHYQNLKINIHQLPVIYLTEKYLLENRLFTEINESSVICPWHQDNQGIYWRPTARCLSAVENKKMQVSGTNITYSFTKTLYQIK